MLYLCSVNYKHFIQNAGFEELTEMQETYLSEKDPYTILLSSTGSGKTLAYQLKLLSLIQSGSMPGPVLIICPTRELAVQSHSTWQKLKTQVSSVLCYGGHSFKNETLQLKEKPAVIFGTPGRLLDHYTRETEGLEGFTHLVIDEYDKTLEMGFLKEISSLLNYAGKLHSVQLVSATEIDQLPQLISHFPFISIRHTQDQPAHSFFSVKATGNDKLEALTHLLTQLPVAPIVVFCTHRDATDRISGHLKKSGIPNLLFHGGMDQSERERALVKFRNGSEHILICTDIASRGLDIPDIQAVIHYQFPHSEEDFTHRNGRTSRMQKSGNLFLLHSESEPLPGYIENYPMHPYLLDAETEISPFKSSSWMTLYINTGRKHKIRKSDIAGFFMKEMQCQPEEIGIIEVFDQHSYVAIQKPVYQRIKSRFYKTKIKKVSARISLCH